MLEGGQEKAGENKKSWAPGCAPLHQFLATTSSLWSQLRAVWGARQGPDMGRWLRL
jgi:hypothetical protein